MSNKTELYGLGVMSGTSLDGMDLALCKFTESENNYDYSIIKAKTIPYTNEWKENLVKAPIRSGEMLSKLHVEYGKLIAKNCNDFLENQRIDFIASHGHTIFHQPEVGFTLQIGSGAEIAIHTNTQTICDFRTNDIALHGQGAPLVPIGDELLFSNYDSCVNLGGFSNISFNHNGSRIAYDICPVNIAINYYCQPLGFEYDNHGDIAKHNSVNQELLEELNQLKYYSDPIPKSLGREWLENSFLSLVNNYKISNEEKIATITEHAAIQIGNALTGEHVLITGGGAYNNHLIQRIKMFSKKTIIVPDPKTIDFKEALIFAFLGYLRLKKEINTLKSATGALRNCIGGCIYIP